MDQTNSITIQEKRKRGKHLIQEERGMIQVLHSQGLTLRAIAEYVGCAHTPRYIMSCGEVHRSRRALEAVSQYTPPSVVKLLMKSIARTATGR